MIYFADTSNTIGWLQIVVPTGVSLLIAAATGWAILAKYKQKVDGLKEASDKHEAKIDELIKSVSKLEGGLERDRANDPYTKRKSPVSLTDRGKALFLDSGGSKYLEEHNDVLV